jgi:hypothetical protein
MAALSKKNMPPPVPAMKVPAELWPAVLAGAELVPIENTRPHPSNARKHSAAQIIRYCAAIAEHRV